MDKGRTNVSAPGSVLVHKEMARRASLSKKAGVVRNYVLDCSHLRRRRSPHFRFEKKRPRSKTAGQQQYLFLHFRRCAVLSSSTLFYRTSSGMRKLSKKTHTVR